MDEQQLNRTIIISEPITDELAGMIIHTITAINKYDNAMSVLSTYEPEPIEIYINSGGGSVTAGNAIISVMEMSQTPIVTYGLGLVASMALAIFTVGDYRIASDTTRFMYHSLSYETGGHITDHEDAYGEANVLQEQYNNLFLEYTNLSKEEMEGTRMNKKDFFFDSKKAIELGIADAEIIKARKKAVELTDEEAEDTESLESKVMGLLDIIGK